MFKHITSCACDNGGGAAGSTSAVTFLWFLCSQIRKWSGARRVAVLLQIRLQGNAAFITLQRGEEGGEMRWCLVVALAASADLIRGGEKKGTSGKFIWGKKKCFCANRSSSFALAFLLLVQVSGGEKEVP